MTAPKLVLSDDQWRERLTPQEFAVLRQAGTERPFTGEYTDTKTEGVYQCRACGTELFRSSEKFESHCGWPSFFDPADSDAVILRPDDSLGMRRVEVLCANCHSHLGHVFEGEGTRPRPTSATASTRSRCDWFRRSPDPSRRHGNAVTNCSTDTRGPVKNGVSSRTWRRASVALRSRIRSTMRCNSGASKASSHS